MKCFAQTTNEVVTFHKDGYTDLVGRFDYTSLSASDISKISKFSIFVCSDELGKWDYYIKKALFFVIFFYFNFNEQTYLFSFLRCPNQGSIPT